LKDDDKCERNEANRGLTVEERDARNKINVRHGNEIWTVGGRMEKAGRRGRREKTKRATAAEFQVEWKTKSVLNDWKISLIERRRMQKGRRGFGPLGRRCTENDEEM
jgi:hypothetical protein